MDAKEMFEKLGYEQTVNHEKYIEYTKEGEGYCGGNIVVSIYDFCFNFLDGDENDIPKEELKAIYQQYKEMGWLDE